MAKNGTVAEVAVIPDCDLCDDNTKAEYDAKTKAGPWANLCTPHFKEYGVGLGTGFGQRLVLAVRREPEKQKGTMCPVHNTVHPLRAHWDCFEAHLAAVISEQDPYHGR